jgi:folate-binding protein YgfZ
MTEGYQALRERAARLDLSRRAKIVLTGEDRARLLHALTTNDIEQLAPGSGCYTFFLNAQGRIQADANVFVFEDRILLDMEPETRERMVRHIDHYIIADDVSPEDATGRLAVIAVEGPASAEILASMGAPLPEANYAHASWGDERTVARASWTGAQGFRVFLPSESAAGLIDELQAAEIIVALPEDARTVRLENGRPRYGDDITDTTLPQETQLSSALSFTKGCYLGQEIVERIRSRGHVNRLLARLEVTGAKLPCPPPKLLSDEADAGNMTSLVFSPALNAGVGLAYIRAQFLTPGAQFALDGAAGTARVTGPARI